MNVAVKSWLDAIGLGEYAEVFAANAIDSEVLLDLRDDELKELGVPLGHRKKLLKAIAELKAAPVAQTPGAASASSSTAATPHGGMAEHGERRQLTVLFCDVVGYTELASRIDPEVLQGVVRSYEDACAACVTRYDGYVFQRLGDGIVAFFGYPLAHEGEAERAVRAGLEIIESLARLDVPGAGHLAVRIGIATGLVVVSSAEKGAVGETMNLAARLEAIAEPGSIVVSERVHRLAGGAFDYRDLGEQALKGIAKPTRVYRVLGVSAAASRFEAAQQEKPTPLVGREQELALLLERWALAQDGEGQVVLLSGEPGIGKSRILSALSERLAGRAAQALRFQCSPYYVNSALWPSIDNFERALKFARDESHEAKLDKLEALIVAHGRPRSDTRFVASMMSIPCEERYKPLAMTPQKHKDETLRTLVDLTEAAARKKPSVMLFEDLHWADPTTLEVMDLLIDRTKSVPLLIVLTHRPEFQPRWSEHGHVAALNLSKLTRPQSAAMVARLTADKALPPELMGELLTKTDGVPLFVEELTKAVLESGELKELGDRYEYAGSTHRISIPATLRDSLMARLDRYAPVKEIAQVAAAIGREFSYELVSAVAPMTAAQLDHALAQLTDSGLAFRRGTPPDASYTFKHALVQDAAYDSLLKSRRLELHGKIARVIEERFPNIKDAEPEVLAHHYTRAGALSSAIPLWQKAGELALARMALAESISHLNQGLELIAGLPASDERDAGELALRTTLGTAYMALKAWPAPEVWSSFEPALALAKSLRRTDALLPILWGLWAHVLCRGRLADTLPLVEQMLDIAKATGDADLLIAGRMAACGSSYWLGRLTETLEHCDQVATLYDADKHRHLADILNHDPKTFAGVYASLATWMLGYPDRAARLTDEKEAHARYRGHPFDLGFALQWRAEVFDYRREPAEVRKAAEEIDRLGRDNSMPYLWACIAPITLGVGLIHAGREGEGNSSLGAGLAFWDAVGAKLWSPYGKALLADGMALTGDLDNALQLIEAQIEQVERPGWEERIHYAEILRLKGWMLSLKGDLEGAEKNYLASLDWSREQQSKSWELRTATSLARLWESQGRHREAYAHLAPVYEWFTEGFDTHDLKEAKGTAGSVELTEYCWR